MGEFRKVVLVIAALAAVAGEAWGAGIDVPADIVVAADGSGDFTTVQAAVASIPRDNRERMIVLVKNGVYREKVRVDADCVTLRGESRTGTRIEFPQLNDDFTPARPDRPGGHQRRTATTSCWKTSRSPTRPASSASTPLRSTAKRDRTVIVDCDVLSDGADTLSLWNGGRGRYYHAGARCGGRSISSARAAGATSTDCDVLRNQNVGRDVARRQQEPRQKFVLRNCTFDGVPGWSSARHHHDAAFYFLASRFSTSMIDRPPLRVIYPLGTCRRRPRTGGRTRSSTAPIVGASGPISTIVIATAATTPGLPTIWPTAGDERDAQSKMTRGVDV